MVKLKRYWVFPVQIPQDTEPATLTKIAQLSRTAHIDGKIPPHDVKKAMVDHLECYLRTELGPYIKKPIFGSLVCGIGAPYLQVIELDDDNNWCWDSINFDSYSTFYDLQKKGALMFLAERLKKINHGAYYQFCKKHGVELGYSGYHGNNVGLAKEALMTRIMSEIDATHNTYYQEGYEADYINRKYDPRIHKEEYLYEVLEEAREDYDETKESTQHRIEAFKEVKGAMLGWLPDDPMVIEIFNEIEKTLS